ncbi:MOSC domain-containing protein [Rhabdobacter roseus]|uniref:MOSC domain-containing protein YiiM n=1 Tax=Rhabdobacter roseus TaxID=1655419 RepID=A0A840TY29_9BACT|nr:MOSC domain-containing protein [Rhabdobacter roseus]MBB5284549.1 MOSC domain-containing protein YiiM [Rhabdobacter roseus]
MATLPPDSPLHQLMQHYAQPGEVTWIGVRPASRQPVQTRTETYARVGTGLDGDRYRGKPESKRQVTLIQEEHLRAVASYLGQAAIDPALVRRNIVVRGINLLSLKDKTFRIGEAVLEYTGECHPCSRMEEVLGPGGYNAMRQHGGITARVVLEGEIHLGNAVEVVED